MLDTSLNKVMWSHTTIDVNRTTTHSMYNERLQLVVQVIGGKFGFFPIGFLEAKRVEQHMYITKWIRQPAGVSPVTQEVGVTKALVCGGGEFGVALSLLLGSDYSCITECVAVTSACDRLTLGSTLSPAIQYTHLIFLVDDVENPAVDAVVFGTTLLQTVAALPCSLRPVVWFVTSGAQGPGLRSAPLAGLWGLARSVRAEKATDMRCVCIDLPKLTEKDSEMIPFADFEDQAVRLANEIHFNATLGEDEVVLRANNDRLVPRLARAPPVVVGPIELHMNERGSLSNLVVRALKEEITETVLPPGSIRLNVKAVGLNFRDVLNVMGLYPGDPGMPGGDCAGVIDFVGEGVSHVKAGDRVFGVAPGSLRSSVTTDARLVVKMPNAWSFEEACTLPITWATVHTAFEELAHLQKGQRVLIHAATGGVGLIAVEFALGVGAIVYATAGSEEKHEYLRSIGVTNVTSSRVCDLFSSEIKTLLGDEKLDAVLNSLTHGDFIPVSLSLLKKGGHFLEIGKRNIWTIEQMEETRPDVNYHQIAVDVRLESDPMWLNSVLSDCVDRANRDMLTPLPQTVFDLRRECVEAFRFLQRAAHIGKVVVRIDDGKIAFRKSACYVITGGTGALGVEVAMWMLERGAGRVVLLSRSGLMTPGPVSDWLSSRKEDVRVWKCDVADPVAVMQALQEIGANVGPIRGIVHAAGILADKLLDQQTAEGINAVWHPKVTGAYNLINAVQSLSLNLDMFVFFSSIASLFGSTGQLNYSAANAVLDAWAEKMKRDGVPVVSVQWGPWGESGMAVTSGAMPHLEKRGMRGIMNEEALIALELALQQGGAAVMAMVALNWRRFLENSMGVVSPFVEAFVAKYQTRALCAGGETGFVTSLYGKQGDARVASVKAMVIRLVREETGVVISATDNLVDAGVDSLSLMELRNGLRRELGSAVRLEQSFFYDHPTIDLISQVISKRINDTPRAVADATLPSLINANAMPLRLDIIGIIIGIACRLPGNVRSPDELWTALMEHRCVVTQEPPVRWLDACKAFKVPHSVLSGAFLDNIAHFDVDHFGLTHMEVGDLDPHAWHMLEVGAEALADAAMYKVDMGRPTGVFSASTWGSYVVTTATADIPRKLAQLLGLTHGPREHYDLACTSSHAATHKAKESIARGDCDAALVLGASLLLQPESSLYLLENGILSRAGVSRPLDDQSDGLVMGEVIHNSFPTARIPTHRTLSN